ncbi:MAG: (2Fe-2S)-binding protein [Campylobacteraceae bacterium]|nr:(2Fe-2S)-binding protein [Campylobacteraceae bacterium]
MAKFCKSHIVCDCNQVSLAEIVHAIDSADAKSIEDIKELTDAGNTCGCCISKDDDVNSKKMELYISQILNKFNKES